MNRSLFFLLTLVTACGPAPDLTRIGLLETSAMPPSPTNAYADLPAAAELGQALFFDPRMSADGNLSCATCHDPANNFTGVDSVSEGSFGRLGGRHAPTLINVAWGEFQLWDGRADSLWSQPIKAIEAEPEGDFSRTELAHFIGRSYRAEYEAVFGALQDLSGLPAAAKPGDAAWSAMSLGQRVTVNRIAANVGKAIEAYERRLVCVDTPLDQHLRGESDLSQQALAGAEAFLDTDGAACINCHSGPNLSDGLFHDLGIADADEPGRPDGIAQLLADPFNGVGAYSDDLAFGQARLEQANAERSASGSFKTPSLRGVAQRGPYGHLGLSESLDDWFDDVYDRRGRGRRNEGRSPLLGNIGGDERELKAFLAALSCEPLPAELSRPPAWVRYATIDGSPESDEASRSPDGADDDTPDDTAGAVGRGNRRRGGRR